MAIILGIDPGSRVTGYGVIDANSGKPRYLASGCIRLPKQSMAARLAIIFNELGELIAQYQPEQVAIERVFVGKSADSALKLGHARGVAMLAATLADIPVEEYAARTIKQAVAGSGAADKQQIQAMVVRLLQLNAEPAEDAADALAAALCWVYKSNFKRYIDQQNRPQHAAVGKA
jgi:crossover junction endodeoxyribonuclease RuvC